MTRLPTLSRYVVREVLAHVLGVTAIVLGVSVLERLGGLLADAAEGSLPSDVVFSLLGLRTLVALPSLLPAALYFSIVLALGRLHQDHEMAALEASGISPLRVAGVVLVLCSAVAFVVAILSFFTSPWAALRFRTVKEEAVRSVEVGGLVPRRFYEVGREGRQVIFAEARGEDGQMSGVFVQEWRDGAITVFSADHAIEHRDPRDGRRSLELLDGYRYDLEPEAGKHEITAYRSLEVQMSSADAAGTDAAAAERREIPTRELLGSTDPLWIAELQWRLAMPISAVLLGLLAFSLGRVAPQQGKYARLFVAVVVYLAYHQLLIAARHWVADGRIAPWPGLLWVHALCLGVGLVLLARDRPGAARSSRFARARTVVLRGAPSLGPPGASPARDA